MSAVRTPCRGTGRDNDTVAEDADADSDDQDSSGDSAEQDTEGYGAGNLEEVITTGTRSKRPRSAADSPVPIDVFSSEDISSMGNTADLTDAQAAID
jgi:hypothetical protein